MALLACQEFGLDKCCNTFPCQPQGVLYNCLAHAVRRVRDDILVCPIIRQEVPTLETEPSVHEVRASSIEHRWNGSATAARIVDFTIELNAIP